MSKNPPFVMIVKETLDAPAWKAMSHGARSLFIALKRRYSTNFKNNGRIYLSQRSAAAELGSGTEEIGRWFQELQFYGFIVMTRPGALGVEGKGKAPHWRLTDVGYMRGTGSRGDEGLPTRDFLKWDGGKFRHKRRSARDGKTRSRPGKAVQPVPERRDTAVPERRDTEGNNRTGEAGHIAGQSVPERQDISSLPFSHRRCRHIAPTPGGRRQSD